MTSRISGIARLTSALAAGTAVWLLTASLAAADVVGQPTNAAIGLQPADSEIRRHVAAFHNHILLPVVVLITLLVAVLLLICIFRFNHKANPTPARWSHNTPIEVLWTVIPVLILVFIAVFSFKLLFEEHDMPRPYMTVKVTGRQWNWDYEYPDQKIPAYTSTPMSQDDARAKGLPYLLAADQPMVVPVNKVVRVQVTGEDVIHSFSLPAFGVKIDAVPGRLNETWFKAEHTGTIYGQCSQLCGLNHAFMPIEVNVVTQPQFDAWVASKAPKIASAPTPTPAVAAAAPGIAAVTPVAVALPGAATR